MNTIEMLQSLKDEQFIDRVDAAKLASIALKEYSRRSKAAAVVENKVLDMDLAGGCPNAVYNAVENLAKKYNARTA